MTAKKVSKPQTKKTSNKAQVWARNYYITGYGRVVFGEEVTAAQMKAWNAISTATPKTNDSTTESSK